MTEKMEDPVEQERRRMRAEFVVALEKLPEHFKSHQDGFDAEGIRMLHRKLTELRLMIEGR